MSVAAVVAGVLLALARPQWGFAWEEAKQQGLDIIVAIDTSRSMLAQDVAPNRLERAKLAVIDLMRLAKNGPPRPGRLCRHRLFAGAAHARRNRLPTGGRCRLGRHHPARRDGLGGSDQNSGVRL